MKSAAQSFVEFFESSFQLAGELSAHDQTQLFLADFIHFTPQKLELLESLIDSGNLEYFYVSLADLKYLVEFSGDFSRYWYLMRAYSGALYKLQENYSVKGSKKVYCYYFDKYGGRRILKDEHWFEEKRWEFLDELSDIFSEEELGKFIAKYQQVLRKNLSEYRAVVMAFIKALKSGNPDLKTIKIN